jgi:hypothetical protein
MAALSLKWVPVLLALIVAMISGAAYMIFRDPESGRLMEKFAQEAASEAREASKVRAPALTDAQFAEHAVQVGLYTSIYAAFRRVLGGPAPGESVAEVAQAYRIGAVDLQGILEYVSGKDKDYWMRRGGVEAFSEDEKTSERRPIPEQRLTIAEHIWAIGEALGRSIPFDALRSAEAAVAEGFVNMQNIYECVSNARKSTSFPLEAFEGEEPEQEEPGKPPQDTGEPPRKAPTSFTKPDGTFDLAAFNAMVDATTGSNKSSAAAPPASASVPNASAARQPPAPSPPAADPDRFRRPDGTFDLAGFNAASGGTSAGSAKAEMAAKTLAASEEERKSDDRRLADGGRGGAPSPDDFRKQDGTFDTAAFNADFMKRVADGKASRAGSEDAFGMSSGKNGAGGVSRDGPGITPLGGRERDDGPSGRSGSSAEADEYMRKIVAAEGRAEAREPYRVFPFPHAPSFVANRFADDNERLGDRVSALYRTVFGTPPDRTTRKFLTGRLRAWSGDMRRLSNLVSTMHTMASAQAVKTKSARDASVAEVVRALESGASEKEARERGERASAKAAADAAEKAALDGRVAVETPAASAGEGGAGAPESSEGTGSAGSVAISEVASVSGKLLSYLERDGVPPERAERDVATAIADWMESQLAIASADSVPRSTTDVYLDSRDLGMLVKSRQFQDPVEAL